MSYLAPIGVAVISYRGHSHQNDPFLSRSAHICGGTCDRLGDLNSKLAVPRMILYSFKKKMGVIPDFESELESTANTSLVYHAGMIHVKELLI